MNKSRIASIVSLMVVLLMTFGNFAAYAQIACPKNISVEQKAVAPNEWSVDYSKAPSALSSATIFEGPPEEQVSLKYDDERTMKGEIIQTWALPASERGYWIVCGYANTSAQLRRKLANDIRACDVILETGVTFGDGAAVVKRAECSVAGSARKPIH